MREIKFRGIVPKSYNENFYKEKFVYGSLIFCEDDITSTIINDEFEAQVLTKTVGEYTGIKDKNGLKIYEGDICSWTASKTGKSTIDGSQLKHIISVVVYHKAQWIFKDNETWNMSIYSNVEVIGSIHKNPELLQ